MTCIVIQLGLVPITIMHVIVITVKKDCFKMVINNLELSISSGA